MKTILRNIAAVVLGWFLGSVVNMALVMGGMMMVHPPEGFNPNDLETFALLRPVDLIFPFFAHALGTLVGAVIAFLVAGSRKMVFALVIGGVFLLGGIYMIVSTKSPIWFNAIDLLLAYIPMALLGGKIGQKLQDRKTPA